MTSSQRLLSNTRGMRYGEIFLAFLEDEPRIEVYNTFTLNECPDDLWRDLDPSSLAAATGASLAVLNGPRYWMMDGIGKVTNVEPTLRNFGGIDMRCIATLEIEGEMRHDYYTVRHVNRGAAWYFDAGSEVHELTTPDARTFVMQAYCVGVDPALTQENLRELGGRLQLPDGWRFTSRLLDQELVVDTTQHAATVLQDELQNTYTLVQ